MENSDIDLDRAELWEKKVNTLKENKNKSKTKTTYAAKGERHGSASGIDG